MESLKSRFHITGLVENFRLNKEKCEFLLNSSCFPNCPKRVNEYRAVGMHHIQYNQYLHEQSGEPF